MGDDNLKTAFAFLAAAIGGMLAIPPIFFSRATCLASGPHYGTCPISRVPTALVLVAAAVGLLGTFRYVRPE